MDAETFQNLPAAEVATLVRQSGLKVVVFPINGTRRWFLLEHPPGPEQDLTSVYKDYPDIIIERYSEIFQLLFDHGIDTILSPLFGPDLLGRGEDYLRFATEGLAYLATHPGLSAFYTTYQVRVRFYGDYRKIFSSVPYAHLSDLFNGVTAQTLKNDRYRLFFGLFANDATEKVADLAVSYYKERGCVPGRHALVEMYYGEYVEPVDFFIGFDKFSAFDMPLIASGNEDLYFTIAPSPYFTERQLRIILFDHLYNRRKEEPEDWGLMKEFYQRNIGRTLGVGAMYEGVWYPLPQVEIPDHFEISKRD